MKKIDFKSINEVLFEEILPNKLKVIYYKTKKTKNFYITISTLYGAGVTKYKKNGKVIDVIPGTAHFLEHRIMDFTKNKKAMKLINDLGSMPNAYTMHDITNYNIFGGTDLIKNLKLLLDRVFKPNIKEDDVISEKGIIGEEIDMEQDNINTVLLYSAMNNTFKKDKSMCIPVLGEKADIEKITSEYLIGIYNDFYTYDKMHIVVCGDYIIQEVSNYIHDYLPEFHRLAAGQVIAGQRLLRSSRLKQRPNTQESIPRSWPVFPLPCPGVFPKSDAGNPLGFVPVHA